MANAWLSMCCNGYVTNMKSVFLLLILFTEGTFGYRVVCVYTNWSQYRPEGGKFLPEDVDPTLCTHLIYVYAKLKGNKLEPAEWNDEGSAWSEGMYQRVNNLKQINPNLKTLLGVGGWMMGSKDFSKLAGSRIGRRLFAKTSAKFLRDRNFDGLTIDWQHPTKRGGKPQDRINFSLLLKEIRQAFEAESKKSGLPQLLLTTGVSASKNIIQDAYEIDNITKYTDFINVMAYDLHGAWDNYTGHPSQLYPREEEFGPSTEINVDAAMQYWMSIVPDRKKLVLGISTYGRTFTLRKTRHNDYNVPTTGPGVAGEFTQQPGMLAYYERCSQYADAPRVWDPVSQVAYWYSGDQWIAGEDVESVKAKVNWTRTYDIGGMMLWSLDTDDFLDKCQTQSYPLLNTIMTDINDPNFVPENISVHLAARNRFKATSKDIIQHQRTSAPVTDMTPITVGFSMTMTPPTVNPPTTENSINLSTKKTVNQVKFQKSEQQKQHLQRKIQETQQMPKQSVKLVKANAKNGNTPVKLIRKLKVKGRLNPKIRKKVIIKKQRNGNHMSGAKISKKPAMEASKAPTKNKNTNIVSEASGKNQKNNSSTKQTVVIDNHTIGEKEAIKVTVKKKQDISETEVSLKTKEQSISKGTVKIKTTNRADKDKSHSKEKTDHNDNKSKFSAEHIILHDRHKNKSTEKQKHVEKPVVTVSQNVKVSVRKKERPVRILRRKIKKIGKSPKQHRKDQNSSAATTTVLSKDNLSKSKSVNKMKNEKLRRTTPVSVSKNLSSTTSSPVKSKQIQKQVKRREKMRKGKVLRRGRRIKRRRKKRPKTAQSSAKE